MNKTSSILDFTKISVQISVSLVGVVIVGVAYIIETHSTVTSDILINLGSGFVGAGVASILTAKVLKREEETSDARWQKKIDELTKRSSRIERVNLPFLLGTLFREMGVYEHDDDIDKLIRRSIYFTTKLEFSPVKSAKLIGAFIEPKDTLPGSKEIEFGINSMLLTSDHNFLDQIVSDMTHHIEKIKQDHNLQILNNFAIVTPKKGNPILATKLASRLKVPIIFFNDREKFIQEHFEGDFPQNTHWVIVHDIVESGNRIIDLAEKIKSETKYQIQHAFVLVARCDGKLEKVYGPGKNDTVKIHALHSFNDEDLKKMKEECITSQFKSH